MAIRLLYPESPIQRLARYRKLSDDATKLAIDAPNFEVTKGFLRLAREWEGLADQARTEVEQERPIISMSRLRD
jgi:hypothetical protein